MDKDSEFMLHEAPRNTAEAVGVAKKASARTFTAKPDERAQLVRSWFGDIREPREYPTPVIWAEPTERDNGDGSKTIGLGFPIMAVTSHTNEGQAFAELVAWLLTEHYAKTGV